MVICFFMCEDLHRIRVSINPEQVELLEHVKYQIMNSTSPKIEREKL